MAHPGRHGWHALGSYVARVPASTLMALAFAVPAVLTAAVLAGFHYLEAERSLYVALGIMVVSLFLIAAVRATMTRPLLEVIAYVRAIAAGRAGSPPDVTGPREMAQLLKDVDRMAETLRDHKAALQASEDRLRQAHRMESVGSLAGAMAHDFNNLLTGILGYTRLLLNRVGPGDPIRRQLAAIENSATRAADLTAQLLTFSRQTAARPAPADLGRALGGAIDAVRSGLPAAIDLHVEMAGDLWPTSVEVPQIDRVLSVLCDNAREAMRYGGRLTIGLANRTLEPEDCRGCPDARPGRFVALRVADTGRGLAPEIRGRLFEPFVTTKKGLGGAGLGLATAYGLVRGNQGWIEVTSSSAQGACFTVFLPACDLSPARTAIPADATTAEPVGPPAPPPAVPVTGPAGKATILAVDDESTVLALARDVLEMHGHRVLTARNGEEALRVFREHQSSIDLVLLDLTMPVMGGLECFRRMRQQDPGVRVVISSGFSSESSAAEVLDEGALDFLQKPYDIDCLARTVAAALRKGTTARAAG